jgi:AraC family transcriptional regulator
MRHATKVDHLGGINKAILRMFMCLDDPLDSEGLAAEACLSKYHFHRMFQALTLETPGDMFRRLRLERAAMALVASKGSITAIAFDAGYATHEAFIRAFKGAFGCTPSSYRSVAGYSPRLPSPNGVHIGIDHPSAWRIAVSDGEKMMEFEVRNSPARKAVVMAHNGPYFLIGQTFGKLAAWWNGRGPMGQGVALYYDDPSETPVERLRSDAGCIVSHDLELDDSVRIVEVPGGEYAVATYVGPYEGLGAAWAEFYGVHLANLGRSLACSPSFELYLNDCNDVPPEQLRTEIWAQLA